MVTKIKVEKINNPRLIIPTSPEMILPGALMELLAAEVSSFH